jgi:hypothetical protein
MILSQDLSLFPVKLSKPPKASVDLLRGAPTPWHPPTAVDPAAALPMGSVAKEMLHLWDASSQMQRSETPPTIVMLKEDCPAAKRERPLRTLVSLATIADNDMFYYSSKTDADVSYTAPDM